MDPQIINKLNIQLQWLSNSNNFSSSNKPKVIPQFYMEMEDVKTLKHPSLKYKIQKCFLNENNKNVFCHLKWLIVFNEIIRNIDSSKLLNNMIDLIMKMPEPQFQSKYQSYVHKTLVVIYKQYLIKLANFNLAIGVDQKPSSKMKRKQNQHRRNVFYYQYNIVVYATREFKRPIKQFTNIFYKCYPILNHYLQYLQKDIDKFYRRIRLNFQTNNLPFITYSQIQKLGLQISIFNINYKKYLDLNNYPSMLAESFELDEEQTKVIMPLREKNENILKEISINY